MDGWLCSVESGVIGIGEGLHGMYSLDYMCCAVYRFVLCVVNIFMACLTTRISFNQRCIPILFEY